MLFYRTGSSKNMLKDFFPKRKKGGIFQAKKGKNEIYTNNKGRRINFNWTVFLFTQQIKYIHQCWLADGNFVFSSGLMEFSLQDGKRNFHHSFPLPHVVRQNTQHPPPRIWKLESLSTMCGARSFAHSFNCLFVCSLLEWKLNIKLSLKGKFWINIQLVFRNFHSFSYLIKQIVWLDS